MKRKLLNGDYKSINWRGQKKLIDKIFLFCVAFLLWVGEKFGLTYNEINVIIFVIIWPIITIILFGYSIHCFITH